MTPQELEERRKLIRLPKKTLAERSGLDEMTIGRTLAGQTDPRFKTLTTLAAVIEAEELRLRDYLVGRHGLPSGTGSALP